MTREKAVKVNQILCKIETYERLIEEIPGLNGLEELTEVYGETEIETELTGVVQVRLDKLLRELEEM